MTELSKIEIANATLAGGIVATMMSSYDLTIIAGHSFIIDSLVRLGMVAGTCIVYRYVTNKQAKQLYEEEIKERQMSEPVKWIDAD